MGTWLDGYFMHLNTWCDSLYSHHTGTPIQWIREPSRYFTGPARVKTAPRGGRQEVRGSGSHTTKHWGYLQALQRANTYSSNITNTHTSHTQTQTKRAGSQTQQTQRLIAHGLIPRRGEILMKAQRQQHTGAFISGFWMLVRCILSLEGISEKPHCRLSDS